MKTKGGRVAKRKEQRRARREERLRQQALLESVGSTQWWEEGIEGTPTDQIVETLAKLGIQTDEGLFRELAVGHGSVDGIAAAWLANATAQGIWEDYPWLAARALWARWVPDLFSADVFVEKHLDLDLDEEDPETPEEGQRHWQMALAVMDVVAPRGGPVQPDLLQELNESSALAIDFWLANLPLSLARLGMVEEAVEICRRMAPVYEPENFLGDRAEILARAGRREEALRQVESNLAQFPEDLWVRLTAGDVYRDLGDLAIAEGVYRQALAMAHGADPQRDAAVERLANLLRQTGRGTEADALVGEVEAEATRQEEAPDTDPEGLRKTGAEEPFLSQAGVGPPVALPSPAPQTIPRVGRNEPCPCGSGQKFKRCCGR